MLQSDPHRKEKILTGLKKARSHINKIIEMVENNTYCVDIMQQSLAVIGLLRSVHSSLMESHLSTCFKNAMGTKEEKKKDEMIREILKVTRLFNK